MEKHVPTGPGFQEDRNGGDRRRKDAWAGEEEGKGTKASGKGRNEQMLAHQRRDAESSHFALSTCVKHSFKKKKEKKRKKQTLITL